MGHTYGFHSRPLLAGEAGGEEAVALVLAREGSQEVVWSAGGK